MAGNHDIIPAQTDMQRQITGKFIALEGAEDKLSEFVHGLAIVLYLNFGQFSPAFDENGKMTFTSTYTSVPDTGA